MGPYELEIQMGDLGSQFGDVHFVSCGQDIKITRCYVHFDGHQVNVASALSKEAKDELIDDIRRLMREELQASRVRAASGDRDWS